MAAFFGSKAMDKLPSEPVTSIPSFWAFIGYLICFFVAWMGWVYVLYPRSLALGNWTFTYAAVSIGFRLMIWVLPVFLYLQNIDGVKAADYLKLCRNWERGVSFGLLFFLIDAVMLLVRLGVPHLTTRYVTWNSILGTSVAVGFIEEIPFRGFIFQKLQTMMGFWYAATVSSLLFMAIHLPGWVSLHMLTLGNMTSVFVLGMLFAAIFRISGSLWSSIVAHSLNDFMTFVVFHN
jgi:CAAX protease family protein